MGSIFMFKRKVSSEEKITAVEYMLHCLSKAETEVQNDVFYT